MIQTRLERDYRRSKIHRRRLLATTLVIAMSTLATYGCSGKYCRDCTDCRNDCVGQLPDPRGSHTQAIFDLHAGKAEADDFVIYPYEWTGGGDQLGPSGRRHLERIAKRLPHETFAVVIESSSDSNLDDHRRTRVLSELEMLGIADAQSRVTVGYSDAEGLSAADADRVAAGVSRANSSSAGRGGITNSGGQLGGFRGGFGGGF